MKSSDRAPLARTWSKSLSIRYKLWTWFALMPQLSSWLQISEAFALLSQWLAQRSPLLPCVKPPLESSLAQWDVTPLFTCSSPVAADEGRGRPPRPRPIDKQSGESLNLHSPSNFVACNSTNPLVLLSEANMN